MISLNIYFFLFHLFFQPSLNPEYEENQVE